MRLKKLVKQLNYLNDIKLIKSIKNGMEEKELYSGCVVDIPKKYLKYHLDDNDYGTGENGSIFTRGYTNKYGVNCCEIIIYIRK